MGNKKTNFIKKIFGQKSNCCSVEIEEIDSNEKSSSDSKEEKDNCCFCSKPIADKKKDRDSKK
jgi:hypothetical protein